MRGSHPDDLRVEPAACVAVALFGWWLGDAGIVFLVGGLIALVASIFDLGNRRLARQILNATGGR